MPVLISLKDVMDTVSGKPDNFVVLNGSPQETPSAVIFTSEGVFIGHYDGNSEPATQAMDRWLAEIEDHKTSGNYPERTQFLETSAQSAIHAIAAANGKPHAMKTLKAIHARWPTEVNETLNACAGFSRVIPELNHL